MLSIEEICAYREIYYEHVKPALKLDKDIEALVEYIAPEYGLTEKRFYELFQLDLIQRVAEFQKENNKLKIRVGNTELSANEIDTSQMLRCERRTEQFKDK